MAQATEKISGKGVVVTHFGVDTDKFKPQKSPSTFVIGTVRALRNIYGIDILIKAFALFSRRPPGKKARLLIVGDGPLRNDLEELTINLGISDKVEFRGKVSHERIPDILSEMSLFAVLSRSESYCVAALEAQACGLPVVASNVGGLPEVVDNGVTGILIPPENPEAAAKAFARISSDSALKESMSKAAVSFVRKKFDEDNCTEKILEIYRELL
jgi:glycosyltransferase involved in cell wall biosynthesis